MDDEKGSGRPKFVAWSRKMSFKKIQFSSKCKKI